MAVASVAGLGIAGGIAVAASAATGTIKTSGANLTVRKGPGTGYAAVGTVKKGAKVLVGGKLPDGPGFFYPATVLTNVPDSAKMLNEEIFGPVISVIPAADEEEAIRIANDTPFGLNNSVFTDDIDKAVAVGRRLRSGTVGHNAFRSDFGIAFGGYKQSGIGREGGRLGLMPYLEAKTLILEEEPGAASAGALA